MLLSRLQCLPEHVRRGIDPDFRFHVKQVFLDPRSPIGTQRFEELLVVIFRQRTACSLFLHKTILEEPNAGSADTWYVGGPKRFDARFLGLGRLSNCTSTPTIIAKSSSLRFTLPTFDRSCFRAITSDSFGIRSEFMSTLMATLSGMTSDRTDPSYRGSGASAAA
jgi:hypothetical protein